jgi:hypothetical protein
MNEKIKILWSYIPVHVLILLGFSTIGVVLLPKIAHASTVTVAQNGPPPPPVTGIQTRIIFSATPASGAAPLNISFSAGNLNPGFAYSINFGDGTNATLTLGNCHGITAIQGGQGGIICSSSTAHTYTSAGTYTATLLQQWVCPAGQTDCPAPQPPPLQTVGTATITVSQR